MAELYQLPDGWEWKKLGDVSKKIFAGGDKPEFVSEFKTNELNIPIYANAVKDNGLYGYSNVYKVDEECLTISARGTIGFTVVRNEKFLPIVRLIVVIPNEQILSKILKYYLDYELVENTGSSIPQLTVPTVKELFFPLPPLEEQKRIVSKLDTLFEKIDKSISLHQKNIDETNFFMASVLNDVFVELEGKYEKKQLNEVIKIIGGGTPFKANKEYWENGTIKWATVGDMNVETITKTELSITEIGLKNSSSNIIPKNGIIIATRVGLGKVCYLKDDIAINQDLKGLIPKDDKLNIRYLFNFFKNIEKYILSNGTGATVKGVKLEFIKELELPLPNMQTQQKIVAYLDEISQKMEKIKQIQKEKMQNLKALKASILDSAFRGEL